ncbi:hypothetical protein PGTUg99_015575 [Puccinia graminis f. sp. tritici]|uniref:Uncharacterized protein n=1 Tax=Puccinia graminis f. sp. tritici TaxID=56615 RepID=A0A5B0P546_PUCGR|nr:hypothetical protein PGTUg99_015575 [Puccinia graminis f. sp. tritici]
MSTLSVLSMPGSNPTLGDVIFGSRSRRSNGSTSRGVGHGLKSEASRLRAGIQAAKKTQCFAAAH